METNRQQRSLVSTRLHRSTFEKDAVIKSLVSKLVTPQGKQSGLDTTTGLPTRFELQPILRDNIQRSIDADNAFEVLPDLEMVAQIAISSILSSKDLITTTLVYDTTSKELPLELKSELLKVVSDHLDDEYKLPTYLYDILYEMMFKSGSYPAAIIPESSVDYLIKSGREGVAVEKIRESLKNKFANKGILGSIDEPVESKGIGLESLNTHSIPLNANSVIYGSVDNTPTEYGSLHLTDNIDVLKLPSVKRSLTSAKVTSTYNTKARILSMYGESSGIGTESSLRNVGVMPGKETSTGTDFTQFDNSMYSDSPYGVRHIEELPTASFAGRANIGHPLVQHIPAEAVIPVHVPGDFKNHVAYLVLLDRIGNPINRYDLVNANNSWAWFNTSSSSQLIENAAKGLGFNKVTNESWTLAKLTQSYSDLVDRKLRNSLANGIYGESVTITRPQEVYRIMMARALAKKQTQILCIPSEQMTYFAFDYTDSGIGRSLTDKNKIITAGRTAVMFATLQSSILNATRNMEYTIELSPEDREGEATIDMAQHRIMQTYGNRLPLNGSIDDMEAYFTNAGISFNIQGNDYYPSTKISVSDNTPDYKVPDKDIEEELAKRNYRGFGVDPDLILTPQSIEFATQVLSKDLIATKQVCQRQEKFAPLITNFCRQYVLSSGILIQLLADEIKKHFTQGERKLRKGELGHHLNEFINTLTVSLPPPDMSMLASQMEAYSAESNAIEELVNVWIDDDFLSSANLDVDLGQAKAMITSYLKRNWFRRNGVMAELTDIFDDKEKRAEIMKAVSDDSVNIAEFILMAMKRVNGRLETVNNKYGGDVDGGEEDSFDASDDSNSDDSDFDSGDDSDFGDDGEDDNVDTEDGNDDAGENEEAEVASEDDGSEDDSEELSLDDIPTGDDE